MLGVTAPRILAIVGSGETAPTMTPVHAELFERAGEAGRRAVMLDTPFGFQENADEVAARSVAYFHDSVGREVAVATFRNAEAASPLEYEQMCANVAQAGWVFAGPGSPTYALRQWRDTRVPELLAGKLVDGGVVVFSSAAAVGLGELAVPVYEIYKVGEPPHWIPGLDLLRASGLRAAVVPHYNNAEGGTHDTRYCYMGERRLLALERQLPPGCAILGVDEHTACILDVDAGTLAVRGRGNVIWRRDGAETRWSAGDEVPIDEVAAGRHLERVAAAAPPVDGGPGSPTAGASPFLDQVRAEREAAVSAMAARDPDRAAAAILGVETALHEWSHDTLQSDEPDRARQTLRELVVRLAELARTGTADPRQRVAPLVDALLGLRDDARADRRYADADRIRDAVAAAGVEIHDSPQGTSWELAESAQA
jgi:cyanophycinase-like exopeptidase